MTFLITLLAQSAHCDNDDKEDIWTLIMEWVLFRPFSKRQKTFYHCRSFETEEYQAGFTIL